VRSFLLFTLLATGAIPMTTDAAGSGAAARQDVSRIRELMYFSPVFNTITRGANVAAEVVLK